MFAKLVDEFNFLHTEGITVSTSEGPQQIYFSLGLILGDNLGLHSLLGFLESFTANKPCHICNITKAESCFCTKENPDILRTVDDYAHDLNLNDSTETGIKEVCVFNKVLGFHVLLNPVADWLHDILEGVAKFEIALVLNDLIEKDYFTLEMLNFRINNFKYGPSVSNKPPPISDDELKNQTIRMSANEMLTFLLCLGSIVGDLVPEGDESWVLLTTLHSIVNILMCRSLQYTTLQILEGLIVFHHQLCVHLYGNCLKPKHHFISHYVRILKKSGCLIHIWSMRPESKHRLSKRMANVIFSRKNITLSIAIKHMLAFGCRLLAQEGFDERLVLSSNCHLIKVQDLTNYRFIFMKLPKEFSDTCLSPHHISYKGITYRQGTCLVTGVGDFGLPRFSVINSVLVKDSNVCFVMTHYCTIYEHQHMQCFYVEKTSQIDCILPSDLSSPFPVILSRDARSKSIVIVNHLL